MFTRPLNIQGNKLINPAVKDYITDNEMEIMSEKEFSVVAWNDGGVYKFVLADDANLRYLKKHQGHPCVTPIEVVGDFDVEGWVCYRMEMYTTLDQAHNLDVLASKYLSDSEDIEVDEVADQLLSNIRDALQLQPNKLKGELRDAVEQLRLHLYYTEDVSDLNKHLNLLIGGPAEDPLLYLNDCVKEGHNKTGWMNGRW